MQSQIITQHGNAYSYRAITVHLSQSGDWVCNVNVVEISVLTLIDRTVLSETCGSRRGENCLRRFVNNMGHYSLPICAVLISTFVKRLLEVSNLTSHKGHFNVFSKLF